MVQCEQLSLKQQTGKNRALHNMSFQKILKLSSESVMTLCTDLSVKVSVYDLGAMINNVTKERI